MSATLLELPLEILGHNILEWLYIPVEEAADPDAYFGIWNWRRYFLLKGRQVKEARRDLYNVTLSCRHLNRLGEVWLFRTVVIGHCDTLRCLVRTFAEAPGRRVLVRRIVFGPMLPSLVEPYLHPLEESHDISQLYLQLGMRAPWAPPSPEADHWRERGCPLDAQHDHGASTEYFGLELLTKKPPFKLVGVLSSLAMFLSPNLHEVVFSSTSGYQHLTNILHRAIHDEVLPPALTSLRVVRFFDERPVKPISHLYRLCWILSHLANLSGSTIEHLELPTLNVQPHITPGAETFCQGGISAAEREHTMFGQLRSLKLASAGSHRRYSDHMGAWIKHCKRLESLDVDFNRQKFPPEDVDAILDTLVARRSTLRKLYLTGNISLSGELRQHGYLPALSNLVVLAIPIYALLSQASMVSGGTVLSPEWFASRLPSSLERLDLVESSGITWARDQSRYGQRSEPYDVYGTSLYQLLHTLAAQSRSILPRLRDVYFRESSPLWRQTTQQVPRPGPLQYKLYAVEYHSSLVPKMLGLVSSILGEDGQFSADQVPLVAVKVAERAVGLRTSRNRSDTGFDELGRRL